MTTDEFFARKDKYSHIIRLIDKCNIIKNWHYWGHAELVYFHVRGNNKHMARFKEESKQFRIAHAKRKLVKQSRGD